MKVIDFVSEFEHLCFKFGAEGMTLPDSVVAYMLLASCKLNESDVHLVMSAVSDVTYANVRGAIVRIFWS